MDPLDLVEIKVQGEGLIIPAEKEESVEEKE
jgi:hypothetical protein